MLLTGISLTGFAQDIEEKVEAEQSRSPELAALQTAADLAKYGYANYSPTALIEASRIFAVTQVQEADFKKTKAGTPSGDKKEQRVSFDPQQLLSDAKIIAGKDKTVLALAKRVEEEVAASSSTPQFLLVFRTRTTASETSSSGSSSERLSTATSRLWLLSFLIP